MFRTPRSLKLQAIVDPTGDTARFSGDGKLRIWSTLNGLDVVCGEPPAVIAAARSSMEMEAETEAFMGSPLARHFTPHPACRARFSRPRDEMVGGFGCPEPMMRS